jgi:bacterioferritin
MGQAEKCGNWGYIELQKNFKDRAITEMRHAETLIERIVFLEGEPVGLNHVNDVDTGVDVPQFVGNDLEDEYDTVRKYNEAIKHFEHEGDNATKTILEAILRDEDDHVDQLESLRDQIEQLTLPIFLAEQMGK